MLRTRILTAVLLIPPLLWLVVAGPWWGLPLLVVVASLGALWEFANLTPLRARPGERAAFVGLGTAMTAFLVFGPGYPARVSALGGATLLMGGVHLVAPGPDMEQAARRLLASLAGFLYAGFLPAHAAWLYGVGGGEGWRLVLTVLLLTWAGDTAAYFVGRSLGRHRLHPVVSPKKTWEGAAAGLVGSVLAVFAARWVYFPALGPEECLLLGVPAAVLGQLGDLAESVMKRAAGAKDSGTLIPGHGGVLDRLDALLFAFPYALSYALWIHPLFAR